MALKNINPKLLKFVIGMSLVSSGAMTIAGVMGFVALSAQWGMLPFPIETYWLFLGSVQLLLALLLFFLPVADKTQS